MKLTDLLLFKGPRAFELEMLGGWITARKSTGTRGESALSIPTSSQLEASISSLLQAVMTMGFIPVSTLGEHVGTSRHLTV